MDAPGLLRAARRFADLSQLAFAERAGIAPGTLAAWEAGQRRPSFAALAAALQSVGLDVSITRARGGADDEALLAHLRRPLSDRLRLALGETLEPRAPSRSAAWRSLRDVSRCGTVVIEPPVAHALWVPAPMPHDLVDVTVHRPHQQLPELPGVRMRSTPAPPAPSLVAVTVVTPHRVWVLPPAELALDDAARLFDVAEVLHRLAAADDAGRRRPAHRDPVDRDDANRALYTFGIRAAVALDGADSRSWRLGVGASAAQRLRRSGALPHGL